MTDGQIKAFFAVTADRSHIRIILYVIIIENSGKLAGMKFCHPWVQEGEAKDKGSLITLLHHKYTIWCQFLKIDGDGDNIYQPALWLSHLLKSKNQIIAEMIWGGVVHVFDKNTKLFDFFLKALICVAKLNSSLKNSFAHLVADICRVI